MGEPASGQRQAPTPTGIAHENSAINPDLIAQEFDEGTNTRWQRAALAEIDRVNVLLIAGIELLEYRYEPTCLNVSTNVKKREPRKPGATEG